MKFFELFIHFNSFIYLRGFWICLTSTEKKISKERQVYVLPLSPFPAPPLSPPLSPPYVFSRRFNFFPNLILHLILFSRVTLGLNMGGTFSRQKLKPKLTRASRLVIRVNIRDKKKMSIRLCVYTRVVATLLKALTLKVLLRPMTGKE